ncbi:MAG: DUF302 domain-containing protein [Dehalococcoidia bacterium]
MSTVEQVAYGLRRRVRRPYADTITAVKDALKAQGFGVLTEIDVRQTLKTKLDVDVDPYIILGACNPPLAHRALSAEPEVGMLLPCNVVVRSAGAETIVEAMDPRAAMSLVQNPDVQAVANEARQKLEAALESLVED